MYASDPAKPPKPKIAAIIAMTKNIMAHRSIGIPLVYFYYGCLFASGIHQ